MKGLIIKTDKTARKYYREHLRMLERIADGKYDWGEGYCCRMCEAASSICDKYDWPNTAVPLTEHRIFCIYCPLSASRHDGLYCDEGQRMLVLRDADNELTDDYEDATPKSIRANIQRIKKAIRDFTDYKIK